MGMNDFEIKNGVLVKYRGNGGDVVIPDGVTSIGRMAFRNCSSLTSVVIPKGLESIGIYAFSGCNKLASVIIPEGVKSIGERAFQFCYCLTSIAIPESVESIGSLAFYECNELSFAALPLGVMSFPADAFSGCTRLTSVRITQGNRYSDFEIHEELTETVYKALVKKAMEFYKDAPVKPADPQSAAFVEAILSRIASLEAEVAALKSRPAANPALERLVRLYTFYPLTDDERELKP